MDIAQTNQSSFKACLQMDNLSIEKQFSAPKSSIPYAEVILFEYYSLVKNLSKLDEIQFQALQVEVTSVLDKLAAWLDHSNSCTAVDIFSTLRHLKQKTNDLAANVGSVKSASHRTKHTVNFSYSEAKATKV